MKEAEKIPVSIIGLLSNLMPNRYTHADINSLFLTAGAPDIVPDGSKPVKVQAWLREVNKSSPEPLKVLGGILDDYMAKDISSKGFWDTSNDQYQIELEAEKAKIRESLAQSGLSFSPGGMITKGGAVPTLSLDESVKKHGLKSIEVEIKRGLSLIESDPAAAAQFAGNVLEATLKAYLSNKSVVYKDGYTLSELWKLAAAEMKLKASDYDNNDLRKIVSGLHSIVDGIAHLRNAKSGAHGKSEEQWANIVVKPRHARLALHSAHTVAAYVLELIE